MRSPFAPKPRNEEHNGPVTPLRPENAPRITPAGLEPVHSPLASGRILFSQDCVVDYAVAERFKMIRARLERTEFFKQRNGSQVIAVTSSVPGEGKSFVTVNLARAFATSPVGRGLVIDADLRKPSIHGFLTANQAPGLTDILIGKSRLQQAIRGTPEGFDLLPAGNPVADVSTILETGRFESVINELRRSYRYIFVDTPPLAICHETMRFASAADGTIFVVRTWLAEKELIRHSVEFLGKHRLVGIIANDCIESAHNNSYYAYYYHQGQGLVRRRDYQGGTRRPPLMERIGQRSLNILEWAARPFSKQRKAS